MAIFVRPSKPVVEFLNQYHNMRRGMDIFSEPYKEVIVALYAVSENPDDAILAPLEHYRLRATMQPMLTKNLQLLKEEYGTVIKYCYQQDGADGFKSIRQEEAIHKLPDELVDFCANLCNLQETDVYLPFAGDAQIAQIGWDSHIEGFEPDPIVWAFMQIMQEENTLQNNNIVNMPLSQISFPQKKYDTIFAFPPMLRGSDIAEYLRTLVTNNLKDNGDFVAILPSSACSALQWKKLRDVLGLPNKYSIAVITFRSLLAPYTDVPMCVFHIINDHKGYVYMVDATDERFYVMDNYANQRRIKLNTKEVLNHIRSGVEETTIWLESSKELEDNYNLNPSYYLIPCNLPTPQKNEKLVSLNEIIDLDAPLCMRHTSRPTVGCIKSLSDNYLDCEIRTEMLEQEKHPNFRVLEHDCLLVFFTGSKFRFGKTIEVTPSLPVEIRPDFFAFKLKTTNVLEEYLLYALSQEYVIRQAKALAIGYSIRRLKKEDFKKIKILVPTIEEQNHLCMTGMQKGLEEAKQENVILSEEFRKDLRMKKHSLVNLLGRIEGLCRDIQFVREDNDGIIKDTDTLINSDITIGETWQQISHLIERMGALCNQLDPTFSMVPERINLVDFSNEYIVKNRDTAFQFKFQRWIHQDRAEIIFPREALTIIFDNIVSNAKSHGFIDPKREDYKIEIFIAEHQDDTIELAISNNGVPMSNEINIEDVTTFGVTTDKKSGHSGIGVYEIDRLLKEYNADLEFNSCIEADECPVVYLMYFPSANITPYQDEQ